jgi:excisionase family DNA binding protein
MATNLSKRGSPLTTRDKAKGEGSLAGVVCLTKTQMAAALQVCPRTITEMMRRGEISYFKIGDLVRFRVEDALVRMRETVLIGGNPETLRR